MCYLVSKGEKVQIAEKDIVCYKIGFKRKGRSRAFAFEAYWFTYYYEKGETQPEIQLRKKRVGNYNSEINRGYHSFSTRMRALRELTRSLGKGCKFLGVFIIPKGSKYYYNPIANLYVSNRIVFVKFINKRSIVKLKKQPRNGKVAIRI